jgi:DNA-directed RNA polymerase specialized sigma24 family protein
MSSQPLLAISPARGPRVPPDYMHQATTYSSVLRLNNITWPWSGWMYYHKPVLNYLRGLGCRRQDVEDLAHEILIKLQTEIALKYDSARPFRPYFKAAIRNFYLNHLRAQRGMLTLPALDADGPAAPADDSVEGGGLLDYARYLYDLFAAEADERAAVGIGMLRSWLIDGARQDELAHRRGITDRQVRKHLTTAADSFTAWMDARVNPADLDELATLAKSHGTRFDVGPRGIRGLFTHLSQRKRMRALMILAMIYRQTGHLDRDA